MTGVLELTNDFRVIDGDDFIGHLWDIHIKVKNEGYTQVSQVAQIK